MGYLDANDVPGRHAPSWYAETAGPLRTHPPLEGRQRADMCVVGGGYSGLSAALHLAERGYDVALVEANRIGWGASGRNGGQLGIGPRAEITAYEALAGADDARRVWEIALEANRLVRRLIARHAIDCELTDGAIEAAWKPRHFEALCALVEHLVARYGYDRLEVLERAELRERLASEAYSGGVRSEEAGHLHPLRLALGLARAAETAGARLHERTRATRIASGRVETERGTIEAGHVVLAMNGYLDGLVPAVARRAMPINNFVIATEPLGAARAQALIPGGECVNDTRFVLDYYRLTRDHRLIWGGGESYGTRFPRDIAALVRPRMLAVFPELADLAITHSWGGTLAITGTRFPAFQRLDARTLAISGWSGSGIHMGVMGGAIAAEAAAGVAERWDLLARMPVPPFPGGDWFRKPLLWAAMTWYALRDRL